MVLGVIEDKIYVTAAVFFPYFRIFFCATQAKKERRVKEAIRRRDEVRLGNMAIRL